MMNVEIVICVSVQLSTIVIVNWHKIIHKVSMVAFYHLKNTLTVHSIYDTYNYNCSLDSDYDVHALHIITYLVSLSNQFILEVTVGKRKRERKGLRVPFI